MNSPSFSIPPRYRGYFALALWGALTLLLLRPDMYSLNEGAAKALLLSWSIADQVASSVITFGTPDLRALLYLPIGFLWTGSVFAAKVATVLLTAMAAWILYSWKLRNAGAEQALLGSGLVLIAPVTLAQIDSLAPGVYLLAAFALGGWLNNAYRANPRFLGGWYFAQLFVCVFAVSLHPAGLAYPLSLLWSWRTEPVDHKQQRAFFAGIGLATLFILLIRLGWNDLTWFQNPITHLGAIFGGTEMDSNSLTYWLVGAGLAATLVLVIARQLKNIWNDFTGRTLLLGVALGAVVCDGAWSLLALSILLYFGLPMLLSSENAAAGFLKQRGIALLIVFVVSTAFMIADRARYELRVSGILAPQDQLIKTLADEVEAARKAAEADESGKSRPRFIVASQWPSRTMIACRCDTLPLPPAAPNPEEQLAQMKGGTHLTHLLLDPRQTSTAGLARNLSLLTGPIETVSLQPGGVLLHVKIEESQAPQAQAKP